MYILLNYWYILKSKIKNYNGIDIEHKTLSLFCSLYFRKTTQICCPELNFLSDPLVYPNPIT